MNGDFNAKIGSDNRGYEEIIRQHGLGEMKDSGERFADLCALNNLVIGGSVFQHEKIHKAKKLRHHLTCQQKTRLDHVCMGRKFRKSLQHVYVERGADVASDHHILIAKLK